MLLRQASLGVNFCAPPAAESKPQKFPYAPLKHNPATHFYSYFKNLCNNVLMSKQQNYLNIGKLVIVYYMVIVS
ncbi:MAG: hypothetical protein A2Y00_04935 [Omnitrophica WOR_2 bacterium GWF2_43_52]|nr:MAG: hypothetical protein A2Y00_04935 [Omnitrophica WOR_2 bacterium GWF2_43_52]